MRTVSSRLSFLGTVPLLALAATGIASAQAAPLRIGANATDGFAASLFARDMGFFKKAGLDVDVQIFPNGAAQNAALAGGALDIGISTVTAIANAVLHGISVGNHRRRIDVRIRSSRGGSRGGKKTRRSRRLPI